MQSASLFRQRINSEIYTNVSNTPEVYPPGYQIMIPRGLSPCTYNRVVYTDPPRFDSA